MDVVIGGGQAGLAVGYELGRRGRDFVILDASDEVGRAGGDGRPVRPRGDGRGVAVT